MQRRLGCTFACHTMNDHLHLVNQYDVTDTASNNTDYQNPRCAKAIGAKTRFDIVKEALVKVNDQAQALQRVPQQYTIAVHKFSNYLTQVHAITSSIGSVKTALERMSMDACGG